MKTAAIFTVAVAAISISSPSERQRSLPSIDSQVTFLYYKDVRVAALFYAGTLGLEMTFDEGWVQIYRVSSTAYVGLVDEMRGAHRVAESKPVMLSIVTNEIDAWYAHMRTSGVKLLSELSNSENAPIRAFLVEDPGGYTVEFFQWR